MMKNLVSVLMLTLIFCCSSNFLAAQQLTESADVETTKVLTDKDKLVKKYDWVKSHLKSTDAPVSSVKEMQSAGGTTYVLIESKEKKVMYDAKGEVYCTDHSSLNCVEFYKLNEGELKWKKS